MTTTLSEGVKVPDVGSVNWAGDLEVNWNLLNGALANLSGNVKLDRDNTWTGEQSFTLPIVGSITGTAAKAIADEDGTSIKTGYVNVAGNQTVSGDKSFTGSNTFNNILPNATNTYSLGSSSYQWSSVYAQSYYYNGTEFQSKFVTTDTEQSISQVKEFTRTNSDTLRLKNGRVAIGETISSDAYTQFVFRDKNTDNIAYIRDTYFTDGSTTLSFFARNRYTNGAPSTTGSVSYAYWGIGVDATGKPSASVRGDFAPYSDATYKLGISTNQWKSVYSQTYYYNGTQWGLNQDNTWTGGNAFLAGSYNNHTVLANATLDLSNGNPALSETNQGMILFTDKDKWLGKTYARLQSWTATDQTVTVLGATYRPDANTENDFSVWLSNTSNLKSFHPYGVSEPHLGNAAHKWKTLNGINPGALGMPSDGSNGIELDRTNWVYDGLTLNKYTPTVDGWLQIRCADAAGNFIFVGSDGKTISTSGTGLLTSVVFGLNVLFPARANKECEIRLKCPGAKTAYFYPCPGNV